MSNSGVTATSLLGLVLKARIWKQSISLFVLNNRAVLQGLSSPDVYFYYFYLFPNILKIHLIWIGLSNLFKLISRTKYHSEAIMAPSHNFGFVTVFMNYKLCLFNQERTQSNIFLFCTCMCCCQNFRLTNTLTLLSLRKISSLVIFCQEFKCFYKGPVKYEHLAYCVTDFITQQAKCH